MVGFGMAQRLRGFVLWRLQHVMPARVDGRMRTLLLVVTTGVLLLQGMRPLFAQQSVVLQGNGRLAVIDRLGFAKWEMAWGPIHDLWVLDSGNLMVQQGASRVVEIERSSQKVVWEYDSATQNGNAGRAVEVHAFQPLGDGRVMIAESGPGRLIEVDRQGFIQKEIKLKIDRPHPHTDTRLARKLTDGHYLVVHEGDGFIREYSESGRVVWEYAVPLFGKFPADGHGPEAFGNKAFAAIRLPSGNTLIATGNGHSVIEVTYDGEVVWKLDQRELPGIVLAWVTTLEVLPDGHYLIGNCHAGPGQPQLIEIDPKTKTVVWTLAEFDRFGNDVSNSQVLEQKQPTLR
jgi:PQQ-like domain